MTKARVNYANPMHLRALYATRERIFVGPYREARSRAVAGRAILDG
jgi:hypothetical protein